MLNHKLNVSKSDHIGKIGLIVVLCIAVLLTLLFQLFQQREKLLTSHHWVVHTLEVDDASNNFMLEVQEGTSAVRGYLLTGDSQLLANYQQAALNLPRLHARLVELTQDNSTEQTYLKMQHSLLNQRLQMFELMLDRYHGLSTTEQQKLISESQQITQTIKDLTIQMRGEENRLLTLRESQMQADVQRALILNIVVVLVMALIGSFLAWSLLKEGRHRRQLLQEMATLNSQLETQNANLLAANDAVLEADRLKTEFLSAMSHELRTPLNSIIGFTGILRMGIAGALNDEQKKQLNMVNDSSQHLLHLINDLLDLSRIESGRVELAEDHFDVGDVVAEAIAVVTPLAAKKNLILVNRCVDQSMPVQSDQRKVYQILLNLVNNAVKFSEVGTIEISCEALDAHWRICVKDEGIGIKAEYLDYLFQAFRQFDGSTRRVYEGTGLGLHLSKKLVEMLGGEINVTSTFGKGSCFCFTLPRLLTPTGDAV